MLSFIKYKISLIIAMTFFGMATTYASFNSYVNIGKEGVSDLVVIWIATLIIMGWSLPMPVWSADWVIEPGLELTGTYLDNVRLAPPGEEESDYVTQINPVISIQANGRRADFRLDYRMQNLFYSQNSEENTTNHQLATDVNTEILRDLFFLDLAGSYRQVLISPEGREGFDNLSISEDLTDVGSYSISPYLLRRFGNVALAELRYAYEKVDYSENTESSSDTDTHRIQATLSSDPFARRLADGATIDRFGVGDGTQLLRSSEQVVQREAVKAEQLEEVYQAESDLVDSTTSRRVTSGTGISGRRPSKPLQWNLSYQREKIDTQDDDDSRFEEVALDLSYLLGADWALLAGLGYEDNDFEQSADNQEPSGFFWDAGASWSPYRRLFLEATIGERFFGTTYSFALQHRTRRTTGEIFYTEEFTTTGQSILEDPIFIDDGRDGRILGPDGERGVEVPLPSVDTEVYLRKRLTADISLTTAKSIFSLQTFSETRDFQLSGEEEQVLGTSVSWAWQPTARTRSLLSVQWEDQELTEGGEQEDWEIGMRLTRQIRRNVDGTLEYRYLQRNNTLEAEDEYEQNSIAASVRLQF